MPPTPAGGRGRGRPHPPPRRRLAPSDAAARCPGSVRRGAGRGGLYKNRIATPRGEPDFCEALQL
uniref:Uncharacterized protein n=1 Tax=Oryza nivara TaxID=4536 RepID=A0A0E0J9U5_ORYNI